jgi:hypothetical protein
MVFPRSNRNSAVRGQTLSHYRSVKAEHLRRSRGIGLWKGWFISRLSSSRLS